jgi:hypothetical protein
MGLFFIEIDAKWRNRARAFRASTSISRTARTCAHAASRADRRVVPAYAVRRCRLVLLHPKASKELLADTLAALSLAPRTCARVVSVDMYLIAAGAASAESAAAGGGSVYVVRTSGASSVHIVSGPTITRVDIEVVNGLYNSRALSHRAGGSIRVELAEEYVCGDFLVRRGRVYHKSAVQCDLLEVELSACADTACAPGCLADFVRQVVPEELFLPANARDRAAMSKAGGAAQPSLAGLVFLGCDAPVDAREAEPERTARLFVEVARAMANESGATQAVSAARSVGAQPAVAEGAVVRALS